MPATDAGALAHVLQQRLERLTQRRPDLAAAVALQGALLRESLGAAREPIVQPFPLPRDRLLAKVRAGTPLLHEEPAYVDVQYAADLFSRLVETAASLAPEAEPEVRASLDALAGAATAGRLPAEPLFAEAFVQHSQHLREMALHAGVDGDLLESLAALAVAPLLRAYAAHLAPLLERADDGSLDAATWHKGYCPVCGGWPVLAELRGIELKRYLRCAACATAWPVLRLQCPYCETGDYRQLTSLQAEDDRRFKVEVCGRCHGYLKTANAFDPAPAALLPLEDLSSVHLDVAAIERGYQRPTGAGFLLELAVAEPAWAEDEAFLD